MNEVTSMYWWEGKIDTSTEVLVMMKTETALVPKVTELIKQHHPYDVPEVISAALGEGNEDYYAWISNNVASIRSNSNQ